MFSKYNTNNVNHYMLQIDFEIKEKKLEWKQNKKNFHRIINKQLWLWQP